MSTKTSELHISKDFGELITPLSNEEFAQLEENVREEGCRDPLIVWENKGKTILVDGHHRYKICQKHQIPFDIKVKDFKNKNQVKDWMINNQLGRRNLTPMQLSYFRGIKYLSTKKEKGGHDKVLSKGNLNEKTVSALSKEFKTSPSTIQRDAQFAIGLSKIAQSNPNLKKEILTGNIKVKKSDVGMLSISEKDFTVSNEVDITDLAAHLRRTQLKEVEKGLKDLEQKRKLESAQETLREKEPLFLDREDRIKTIKGKIISAMNDAINNKNFEAIETIRKLIDILQMAIFDE